MIPDKVLLVSGSYRAKKTTTNSILNCFEKELTDAGCSVIREQLSYDVPDLSLVSRIMNHLQCCDVILICFPLYFDTLPSSLISLFEQLIMRRNDNKEVRMIVVVHCGLPEYGHCENALDICSRFAEEMGFVLAAEAVIPDTGAIEGGSVKRMRRIISVIKKVTNIIVLKKNNDYKIRFVAKPSMPPPLFRIVCNMIMKHFAKMNNADLFRKVYGE